MDHGSALTPAGPTGSPFDAIRRTRPDGSEFWSARDFQPLMGYVAWRDFDSAINRAKIACKNSGHALTSNFADVRKINDLGYEVADCELSRFACYLVAMNGDPRKAEISAAQTYFAVKTREQEVRKELTDRERALMMARELIAADERAEKAERALTVVSNTLAAAETAIEVHADDVLFAQDYLASTRLKTVAEFGRALGIGPRVIFRRLRTIGVWQDVADRPYAEHVKAGYFRHDPASGEIKITPTGERWLHGRLYGSLQDRL